MLAAVLSLTILGAVLGAVLGIANRFFHVEGNPLVEEIEALMPGSNCGQCGFPGCAGAAAAIAAGQASPACCPPGGHSLAVTIAQRLGVSVELGGAEDPGPLVADIDESICIGCTRCIRACPTDAILGGPKQIHNVLRDACSGCAQCIDQCPTEAMVMQPLPVTLQQWFWPKPASQG